MNFKVLHLVKEAITVLILFIFMWNVRKRKFVEPGGGLLAALVLALGMESDCRLRVSFRQQKCAKIRPWWWLHISVNIGKSLIWTCKMDEFYGAELYLSKTVDNNKKKEPSKAEGSLYDVWEDLAYNSLLLKSHKVSCSGFPFLVLNKLKILNKYNVTEARRLLEMLDSGMSLQRTTNCLMRSF